MATFQQVQALKDYIAWVEERYGTEFKLGFMPVLMSIKTLIRTNPDDLIKTLTEHKAWIEKVLDADSK